MGIIISVMVVLAAIAVPLIIAAIGAITKMVWDMKSVVSADAIRWENQAKMWQANSDDHQRAFAAIDELKQGQSEISGKLDILIGDRDGSK